MNTLPWELVVLIADYLPSKYQCRLAIISKYMYTTLYNDSYTHMKAFHAALLTISSIEYFNYHTRLFAVSLRKYHGNLVHYDDIYSERFIQGSCTSLVVYSYKITYINTKVDFSCACHRDNAKPLRKIVSDTLFEIGVSDIYSILDRVAVNYSNFDIACRDLSYLVDYCTEYMKTKI